MWEISVTDEVTFITTLEVTLEYTRSEARACCARPLLACMCMHFICVSTAWKVIAGPTLYIAC